MNTTLLTIFIGITIINTITIGYLFYVQQKTIDAVLTNTNMFRLFLTTILDKGVKDDQTTSPT